MTGALLKLALFITGITCLAVASGCDRPAPDKGQATVAAEEDSAAATTAPGDQAVTGEPDGSGSYADLVALYDEFLEWKDSAKARREEPPRHVAGQPADVYPDYGSEAVEARRQKLAEFQRRMRDMGVARWERPQQVDYLAVRSRLGSRDQGLDA